MSSINVAVQGRAGARKENQRRNRFIAALSFLVVIITAAVLMLPAINATEDTLSLEDEQASTAATSETSDESTSEDGNDASLSDDSAESVESTSTDAESTATSTDIEPAEEQPSDIDTTVRYLVRNTAGKPLPNTGDPGFGLLYLFGGAMIAAAGGTPVPAPWVRSQ